MESKENKSFWEKFREISLYVFAVVTLFFGSGLVWRFCENDNHSVPKQTNEQIKKVSASEKVVSPQVEREQPKKKDTEMTRPNDKEMENPTKIRKSIDIVRKGEGIATDFTEEEAREQALKKSEVRPC